MPRKICGARSRTISHEPCRQPAMANGRCRIHGGKSTGPKTEEGKRRAKLASMKHGFYSAEAIAERKWMRQVLKNS